MFTVILLMWLTPLWLKQKGLQGGILDCKSALATRTLALEISFLALHNNII